MIRRYPLPAYFFLATLISWMIWLPLVLESRGMSASHLPYQHYYGAAGPILAALIVSTIGGTRTRSIFMRRLTRWRVHAAWYLIALFGPVLLFAVATVTVRLSGGVWVDIRQFGVSDEFPNLGLVPLWLVQTVTFGLGEEAGWRGYALPRLQVRNGALRATLILSVYWAMWHIPLFSYRPGYAAMGTGDIAGWFFSIVCGSILLTWLFNSSRGSIIIVALFHGAIDVAFTSSGVGPEIMNLMGAMVVVWAIAVLFVYRPATLSATRTREGAESQ